MSRDDRGAKAEPRRLYSSYGKAILTLQEKMREGLRDAARGGHVPNLYRVEMYLEDQETTPEEIAEELLGEVKRFASANEWEFLSRPILTVHLTSPEETDQQCVVTAAHVGAYGRLTVVDDRGEREVDLPEPVALFGRDHSAPPRNFVPVADSSRALSREHGVLRFDGGKWTLTVTGQNRTTLNGEELDVGEVYPLEQGDRICCEPHVITLREAAPSENIESRGT